MVNEYYVYILASKSRVIYTGVTNDLGRRITEHKSKQVPGFTRTYHIDRLVYYETCPDIRQAIYRERQIKGWLRSKKVTLDRGNEPNLEGPECRLGSNLNNILGMAFLKT